jgi:hypothetical protein
VDIDIAATITAAKDIVTIVAVIVAYVTFRTSVRQKRAEMLDKLYERFYEKDLYKKIRRILDYKPELEFANLQRALEIQADNEDRQLCEDFVNYLNFFEHIASLWNLGQLSLDEILMLFKYYLELLGKIDFVWKFIKENGFENLRLLLKRTAFAPSGGG